MAVDPRRLQDVFLSAVQAADTDGRAAILDRECAADDELRDQVQALLHMHDLPDNALDVPALADALTAEPFDDETPLPGQSRRSRATTLAVGVGSVLAGRYHISALIGEGGMGSVYRAEQTTPVRRTVAIKLIKAGMNTAAVLARFEMERQALALMEHPNIAKVLDAGEVEAEFAQADGSPIVHSRPYFVMELIEGEPISKFCTREGLSLRERLELFIPVCRAVQHAHQKGVIHRDLKPGNILVAFRDGKPTPIVIDFGIAKSAGASLDTLVVESGPGIFIGTLDYMAPEQATYEPANIDTRTDVYALGAILYELLCGVVPYGADRLRRAPVFEVARILREEEPPSPSVRAARDAAAAAAAGIPDTARLGGRLRHDLDWIVMTCLEKDGDRRYPSAGALADDLDRYLRNEPVAAGAPSAMYRMRKFIKRNRAFVVAATAVLFALIGGTAGTTWGLVQARKAEAVALAERDEKDKALAAEAAQLKVAEEQRARANDETAVALSVLKFVQDDMLRQADPNWQLSIGSEADANLTVRAALDRSSASVERRFRDKPLVEAAIRRTIGSAYDGLGETGRAIYHLAKSAALFEKHVGRDDERTVAAQFQLAIAYRRTSRVAESVPLFEHASQWRHAHFGLDQPETITADNCLAIAYVKVGRMAEAEKILNDLYERGAKKGIDTLATLATLNNLAYFDAENNNIERAVTRMEELNQRWNSAFGADSPQKTEMLNNLGQMYQRIGRVNDAIPILEDVRDRLQKSLAPEHTRIAIAASTLADAYWQADRVADAAKVLEDSRNRLRTRFGPNHQRVHLAAVDMAILAAETGDLARAESLARPAVESLAGVPNATMTRALAQNVLARSLYLSGKLDEAEPFAREAYTTFSARRSDEWPAGDARVVLGLILAGQGKQDEARQHLTEGRSTLQKLHGRLPSSVRRKIPEADEALAKLPPAKVEAAK